MYSHDFQQFKNIPSILRLLEEDENEQQNINIQKKPGTTKESEPMLNVDFGEFDPAIQIGRGNKLYLKRNYIER